jgi:hypothetical protein
MKTTRVIACIGWLCMTASCASEATGSGRNGPRGSAGSGFANAAGATGTAGFGAGPGGSVAMPVQPGEPLAPQGDRELVTVNECPGGLAAETATLLQGTSAQPGARWLYPYDQTVFPRGLTAPHLQWADAPSGANAVLIHIRSMLLDYRICLPLAADQPNVQIPQAAWDIAADQSRGKGDPLSIDVTIAAAGSVVRLPPLTLVFALANLKGAIYYNTYGSLLANQQGAIGGVVMRVLPGQAQPEVFLTAPEPALNCIGCHAVSADGSRMVAEIHGQPGIFEGPSSSFDLSATGGGVNPPPLLETLNRVGFSALYPDGSLYVTTGRLGPGPIASPGGLPVGNVPGTFGPETSKLYDADTGMEIAGSGVADYAYMPMFSVDGTKLVFNHMDASGTMGGHTLAVMDFDRASNKFSNLKSIFNDPTRFPGWPFFLPDVVEQQQELNRTRGKRVVFALGEFPDFATQEQPVGISPHVSDLWWVDVDSGMAAPLARANGTDSSGASTLPYGERDAHKNYIPTVSPVAAGGYFWVFFTSKRNHGTLFVADPPEVRAEGKKIWVAAIDIDAAPGTDPSHPAFFLPGQELESGNIRAFAALEPCRNDGDSCETGIDCCCGFCIEGQCGCRQGCAMPDEKCETAADCCDASASCIGGFCAFVVE